MEEELLKRNTDCIYLSPSPLASQKPPSYGDASIGWAQFPINDQCDSFSQFEQQPPLKRARSSEENFLNSTLISSRNHPPNTPMNKGMNNIFFKTRMCVKFKAGMCRNGENCNFAHGMEDIRQPPSNWQELVGARDDDQSTGGWNDDQKIIQKMKLCRKFYNGEECPYGERCNFLHEDPAKFRDDSGRFRESSAISIGTTGTPLMNGSNSVYSEEKRAGCSSSDPFRSNAKPTYWKTKLCTKWEITGHCPFGEKCHFAHGKQIIKVGFAITSINIVKFYRTRSKLVGNEELAAVGGNDGEAINPVSISTKPQVTQTMDQTLNKVGNFGGQKDESCLLKWKGTKKINRIYADWLDDMPLSHNFMKPESS